MKHVTCGRLQLIIFRISALLAILLIQSCISLHSTGEQSADEQACPKVTYLLASNERNTLFLFVGATITRRTLHGNTFYLPRAACRLSDPNAVEEIWIDKAELSGSPISVQEAAVAVALQKNLSANDIVILRIAPATEELILVSTLDRSTLSSKEVVLVVYTPASNLRKEG